MRTWNRLAVCLILGSVAIHGGEGLALAGPETNGSAPALEGIFNLPDFVRCQVNEPGSSPFSYTLAKGHRVGNVEVITINPAEGTVEVMLRPGMRSLVLKITNSPPDGISFQNARLLSVLELYGEIKGRSILHPFLGYSRTLTLRAPAKTKMEAVEAIEAALKGEGLAVVPDGTKFVLVVPQAQAASAVPRSSLIKASAEKAKQPEVLPRGSLDFRNADTWQVVRVYADLVGRELKDADQTRRIASGVICFQSQTPLTMEEGRYALDTLFAWGGLQMVEVGEKGIKLEHKHSSPVTLAEPDGASNGVVTSWSPVSEHPLRSKEIEAAERINQEQMRRRREQWERSLRAREQGK